MPNKICSPVNYKQIFVKKVHNIIYVPYILEDRLQFFSTKINKNQGYNLSTRHHRESKVDCGLSVVQASSLSLRITESKGEN